MKLDEDNRVLSESLHFSSAIFFFLFPQFHYSELRIFAAFIKKEGKRQNLSTDEKKKKKKIKLVMERVIFAL